MKHAPWSLVVILLIPGTALAQLQEVRQAVFGMD